MLQRSEFSTEGERRNYENSLPQKGLKMYNKMYVL